jgi:serine acetyltransferase
MRRTPPHPVNPHIRNTYMGDLYLNLRRKNRFRWFTRMIEHVLCMEICFPIPDHLYIPHPYGILGCSAAKVAEDVTLMQFTLLGPKDPWYQGESLENLYPTLEEGVYVSAGAKVLGPITIGQWSVIGANAVVTEDIPPFSTVFGQNRILRAGDGAPPQVKKYLESRGKGLAK